MHITYASMIFLYIYIYRLAGCTQRDSSYVRCRVVRSGTCTVTRLVWSTSIPCASKMFNSLSSLYGLSHVFSCIGHAQGHYAWLFSIMDDPARLHAERVPMSCKHVLHLQADILRPGDRLSCALCERLYDGRVGLKEWSCMWRIPINKVLLYRCAKCRVLLCFHCWTHHSPVCGSEHGPYGVVDDEVGTFWGKHDGSQACSGVHYRYRAITHMKNWTCYRCLAPVSTSKGSMCGSCMKVHCSACKVIHKQNNPCNVGPHTPHPGGSRTTVVVDRYPWVISYHTDDVIPINLGARSLESLRAQPPKSILKRQSESNTAI